MNYLQKKREGEKSIKRRINLKFATNKNSHHFYFLSKTWCSFPCNRQERKAALSGMWVKGHGKSKDGRVSCRHPSEWTGNNPTCLTHPGNIVWKRKAGKMWLSSDPSHIHFTMPFLNLQWQSERWQQTIEWRWGCGIRKWPLPDSGLELPAHKSQHAMHERICNTCHQATCWPQGFLECKLWSL